MKRLAIVVALLLMACLTPQPVVPQSGGVLYLPFVLKGGTVLHLPLILKGGGTYPDLPLPAVVPKTPAAQAVTAPTPTVTASPTHAPAPTTDPSLCRNLVYREGERLVLNGEPFVFVGVNAVDLMAPPLPEELLPMQLDALARWGVTMIRLFVKPECNLARFERILDLAGERDIRLIVTLQDYYFYKSGGWFRETYKKVDLPHIEQVVTRFRDRPEIAIWEVMNEPWCGGKDEFDDPKCYETLLAWARHTTGLIRSLDPCRPISLGLTGVRHTSLEKKSFRRLQAIETVDIVSVHHVAADWHDDPDELKIAHELGKPVFLGEIYERAYTEGCSLIESKVRGRRANKLRKDMRKALELEVDGYLLWKYTPDAVEKEGGGRIYFCDVYGYFADDPIGPMIRALPIPRIPVPH